MLHEYLSQLSKESEHYFTNRQINKQVPQTWKKWIHDLFVNKPGELTLPMPREDQWLETANDSCLKIMFETTSNLPILWIKVMAECPEIATSVLKSQHSIFVKQGFLL